MEKQTITITPKSRILVVDGLRGFALFGILLAHIVMWYIAGSIPSEVWQKFQNDIPHQAAQIFEQIFIDGKFYTFFSFLFGLSFALQLLGRKENDTNFIRRFAWRLVVLFIIGTIHHIHWRGDILGIYGLLGFVLILFFKISDKMLVFLMFFLMLNIPGTIINLIPSNEKPKTEAEQKVENAKQEIEDKEDFRILTKGTYRELIVHNFIGFKAKAKFQYYSGRLWITMGFFFLGLWVGRKRLFENFESNRKFFKQATLYSFLTTLVLFAIVLTLNFTVQWNSAPQWLQNLMGFMFNTFNLTMTFMYLAGMSLLLSKKSWSWILDKLSAVGKMGLTNYLMQTVFGVILFYGVGFGLAAKFSAAWCFAIAIPIFIFQIIYSKWWMSKFLYGPVEWLWRSATYLKWQPMLRKQ